MYRIYHGGGRNGRKRLEATCLDHSLAKNWLFRPLLIREPLIPFPTCVDVAPPVESKEVIFSRDTQDNEEPKHPRRTKPIRPWDTVYCAGEAAINAQSDMHDRQPHRADGVIHPDVYETNLTQMKEGTRRVVMSHWELITRTSRNANWNLYRNMKMGPI